MSIDKKLKKIQQTIINESKLQEEELKKQIKKFHRQIAQNSQFLDNLEGIKMGFK